MTFSIEEKKRMFDRRKFFVHCMAAASGVGISPSNIASAEAATTKWTDWRTVINGSPYVVKGVLQLPSSRIVNVTYRGSLYYASLNNEYPSWTPRSTFAGGLVGNPPNIKDMIGLTGGVGTGVSTVKFSFPLLNPVMAIWSLGSPSIPATFRFNSSLNFRIVSGGPNAEYLGQSITRRNNIVSGREGNGTILFGGPLREISWTCPNYEGYYGFTIGAL